METKRIKQLMKSEDVVLLAHLFDGDLVNGQLILSDLTQKSWSLTLREQEEGREAVGSFGGLRLRLRAYDRLSKTFRYTGSMSAKERWVIEARMGIWGPESLSIVHKDRETEGAHDLERIATNHPILTRTLSTRGRAHELLHQLLEDDVFVGNLLAIVHQYPGSTVTERWITLKAPGDDKIAWSELLQNMVRVGQSIEATAIAIRKAASPDDTGG